MNKTDDTKDKITARRIIDLAEDNRKLKVANANLKAKLADEQQKVKLQNKVIAKMQRRGKP